MELSRSALKRAREARAVECTVQRMVALNAETDPPAEQSRLSPESMLREERQRSRTALLTTAAAFHEASLQYDLWLESATAAAAGPLAVPTPTEAEMEEWRVSCGNILQMNAVRLAAMLHDDLFGQRPLAARKVGVMQSDKDGIAERRAAHRLERQVQRGVVWLAETSGIDLAPEVRHSLPEAEYGEMRIGSMWGARP